MQPQKKKHAPHSALPRTEAAVHAYAQSGKETDPMGMWTGIPHTDGVNLHPEAKKKPRPVQDVDDL